MIVVKEFGDREFESKEELFRELKTNKKQLISLKKATEKKADAFSYVSTIQNNKEQINKEDSNYIETPDKLQVKIVINTTNFLDSHNDLHINGIWNKSISDNNGKGFLHLQEHECEFEYVISDNAKASVSNMKWKELGYSYNGSTEALIFDSLIEKKRNEFMYNQYINGWVKNHSVGMRYIKIDLAINSEAEYDADEKAVWDKYYPLVANKDVADEKGYFWVVTEAKLIEGSAVVMGSNSATPTLQVEQKEAVNTDTSKPIEPSNDTHQNAEQEAQKEANKKLKEFLSKI